MATRAERAKKFLDVDLYPVIGQPFCAGRPTLDVMRAALDGGARAVQLREKTATRREMLVLALQARKLTQAYDALLIVNDHVDVALIAEADGVHLGQQDLPVEAVRRLGPDLLIGASTHQPAEAVAAEHAGADYINIGPIFTTQTKGGLTSILSPAGIPAMAAAVTLPYTVMGGIHRNNLAEVLAQGARRVAMVTEVTQAPDVTSRVKELRQLLGAARG